MRVLDDPAFDGGVLADHLDILIPAIGIPIEHPIAPLYRPRPFGKFGVFIILEGSRPEFQHQSDDALPLILALCLGGGFEMLADLAPDIFRDQHIIEQKLDVFEVAERSEYQFPMLVFLVEGGSTRGDGLPARLRTCLAGIASGSLIYLSISFLISSASSKANCIPAINWTAPR